MNAKMTRKLIIVFLLMIMCLLPLSVLIADSQNDRKNGLKGDFYTSSEPGAFDFDEKKETVVTPNINFSDLESLLEELTGQADDVSVRWTGQLKAEFTEDYTFSMIGDNGFRLWIDNELVIDHWVNDWDNEQKSTPISLEAGKMYDIKIEYFEDMGGSNLKLSWSSDSQPKEVIPIQNLYLPEDYSVPGPNNGGYFHRWNASFIKI
ncbi:PA14 domain-containing protein [Gracilibacillus sp. JCM 18860]|uniref:PA14 domain-containing protein n=1 Tax=Gracilibacillus sp. JCM 18860 TaxID=1306159 RepID=UPI0006CF9969